MELSERELWAILRGLVLGVLFLLAFAGVFVAIWSIRHRLIDREGAAHSTLSAPPEDVAERDCGQVGFSAVSGGTHLPFTLGRHGALIDSSPSSRG